jgi:ribonuclease HI
MVNKIALLKALYRALHWDRLYEAMPELTRQEVDEFFRELRAGLGEEARASDEAASKVAGAEAWLYADGASKGNPGPAGVGIVLTTPAGEEVLAWGAPIGRATSNVAEYRAVIEGLKRALELKVRRICVLSDSELLILQLRGRYKVRNPGLKPLHAEALGLLDRFEHWEARHVGREQNLKADALATQHAKAPKA